MAILLNDAQINAAYKRKFVPLQKNLFATQGDLWGMIRKTYGQSGDEVYGSIQSTFGGGVGSSDAGTLPNPNLEAYLSPNFSWSRVYGVVELDGLALEASKKSEGAFVNFASKATVNKMASWMRYIGGNVIYNDGTAALGQFSGSTAGTASAPVVTILNTDAATYQYRKGFFEIGDDVNVNTDATLFRITAVDHATNVITLARISGTGSLDLTAIGAGTHTIYMQGSKDQDPYGFLGIVNNSTHYGVAEQYRYAPTRISAGTGVELEDEHLVELVERFYEDTEMYPDRIILPPHHYRRYILQQSDKDRNVKNVTGKAGKTNFGNSKIISEVSYNGVQVAGLGGNTMITQSRFLKPSMVLAVCTKKCEALIVGSEPGFRAFDGQTYLRNTGNDSYKAFLAWYGELFINPFYVGAITGLKTS
jgi:hypothetical protein